MYINSLKNINFKSSQIAQKVVPVVAAEAICGLAVISNIMKNCKRHEVFESKEAGIKTVTGYDKDDKLVQKAYVFSDGDYYLFNYKEDGEIDKLITEDAETTYRKDEQGKIISQTKCTNGDIFERNSEGELRSIDTEGNVLYTAKPKHFYDRKDNKMKSYYEYSAPEGSSKAEYVQTINWLNKYI